ncbi:hypothetical protein [Sinomonas sp. P10A9]|uniref:Uncharacterized protein n=1 Tax=Sinomonas puerhi TaxID=3238584 RepID=A0AB39L4B2_9MICC
MGLFKKHEEPAETAGESAAEHAESRPAKTAPEARKPKREAHAFRQVPPYPINEELADRIAMRAYGDEDHDGQPDIPARPFPG